MVQIVQRNDPFENLGTGLGAGIGGGLGYLLSHKLNEVSTNKAIKDLREAYPAADESQIRLAAKDPVFKKEFYKSQFQDIGSANFANALNGQQQMPNQQQSPLEQLVVFHPKILNRHRCKKMLCFNLKHSNKFKLNHLH